MTSIARDYFFSSSVDELANWLLIGIDSSCRIPGSSPRAFVPLDGEIGTNDSTTWSDDLVAVIMMQSRAIRAKFADAILSALTLAKARGLTEANYQVFVYLIGLVPELNEAKVPLVIRDLFHYFENANGISARQKGRLEWCALSAFLNDRVSLGVDDVATAYEYSVIANRNFPRAAMDIEHELTRCLRDRRLQFMNSSGIEREFGAAKDLRQSIERQRVVEKDIYA